MDETPVRKIIHVDMDAFFASVEQRDNPQWRGKPIAVGGGSERGVVAAASYEARKFGVRSAMPGAKARRLCPDLIFVPHRFGAYREVSSQIRTIFESWTPLVQPLSLDEAFLDVTDNLRGEPSAIRVAEQIRAEILETTRLTASAGVSYNKFLAKIASDMNKPDGLFVITPKQGADFVATLAVRKFHGVGPATARKMETLGIVTGEDLRVRSEEELKRHFGKAGRYYYWASRGIDHRPVNPDQERKSIGSETTFTQDLTGFDGCWDVLERLATRVCDFAEKRRIRARTVTLKLRYADFKTVTRSKSVAAPLSNLETVSQIVRDLLGGLMPLRSGVRLLGVTLSGLSEEKGEAVQVDPPQMDLFGAG